MAITEQHCARELQPPTGVWIDPNSQFWLLPSSLLYPYCMTHNTCLLPTDRPTDQLTTCSTIRPEKLKVPQLVKKFPALYRTRRFITAFTAARHLSQSRWCTSIQSMLSSHFLTIHFNVNHPSTPRSSKWSLSLSCLPCCYMPRPFHYS